MAVQLFPLICQHNRTNLMYLFVKNLTLFTVWLFCKRFSLYNREAREIKTPLIIGCNHPNSFLDAILVGAQMKQRVHFITRSGVFKHPLVRSLLRSVNMIPIYRKSDGMGQLANNDASFEEVRKILMRGEHVLIFVEGFCKHQTTLQLPLKKGAPRMLLQAWADGLDVKFLPVWLRYNSFVDFPKEIDINYGTPFGKEVMGDSIEGGASMVAINKQAELQLQQLSGIKNSAKNPLPKFVLFIPAMLGLFIHFLFYFPLHKLAWKLRGEQYYDSILFCLIAFLYPLFLLFSWLMVYSFTGIWWAFGTVLLLPLLAKSYVLWK